MSLLSVDRGATWSSRPKLQFPRRESIGAEAWVVELSDKRLRGTGWHIHPATEPSAYAISNDSGETWGPTGSTGTLSQSTGLASLKDGRALFVYNQRRKGEVRVWLAVARPTDRDFAIGLHERVWTAEVATQGTSSGEHSDSTDFAFGEPSVQPMPDGTIVLVLWCLQPSGYGVRFVKLAVQ
jgi:hypothetical protein